jgi:hypothetical protein
MFPLGLMKLQDYDDTYCLDYAMRHNACVVSNDRYRDHVDKQPDPQAKVLPSPTAIIHRFPQREASKWLRDHVISYTFVRDEFLPV